MAKKRDKHKKLIKLDEDMTFEEAMSRIAKADKKEVEKAIQADEENEDHQPEEGGDD